MRNAAIASLARLALATAVAAMVAVPAHAQESAQTSADREILAEEHPPEHATAAESEIATGEAPPEHLPVAESQVVTEEDPPEHDWRTEGTGVGTVALDFAVLAPDARYREPDFALGFSFQVVGKRSKWPLMIGLGGGVLTFGGSSQRGPTVGYVGDDGSFHIGSTTERRSVQLRHAEVVLRFQPFWWRIRPFIDGLFGIAVLWDAAHLQNANGEKIADNDVQRDAGALYGAAIGLDWSLVKRASKDAYAAYDLVLTTGVRRMYTSRMERPDYAVDMDADDRVSRANYHAPLAMWQPFVALSIGIDSRAETRRQLRTTQEAHHD